MRAPTPKPPSSIWAEHPIVAALQAITAEAWTAPPDAPAGQAAAATTDRRTDNEQRRRRENCAMARVVGNRLAAAREFVGMSQKIAADRLGFANPAILNRYEKAQDIDTVPFWAIIKAAGLYGCSADFLCGLCGDMDRADPASEVIASVVDEWERARQRDLVAFHAVTGNQRLLVADLKHFIEAATEAAEALDRIKARNQGEGGWEDVVGGARLEMAVSNLIGARASAARHMERLAVEIHSNTENGA